MSDVVVILEEAMLFDVGNARLRLSSLNERALFHDQVLIQHRGSQLLRIEVKGKRALLAQARQQQFAAARQLLGRGCANICSTFLGRAPAIASTSGCAMATKSSTWRCSNWSAPSTTSGRIAVSARSVIHKDQRAPRLISDSGRRWRASDRPRSPRPCACASASTIWRRCAAPRPGSTRCCTLCP